MQVTVFFAVVAGLTGLAVGSPTSKRATTYPQFLSVSSDQVKSHSVPNSNSVEAAATNVQTVGVYICTDANGLGTCAYVLNIPGACTTLTNTGFQDDISFVDPTGNDSTPNATCTVFIDENCTGNSEVISQPYGDLSVDGAAGFNDQISSFSCVASS